MRARRVAAALALAVLLGGAVAGAWRSARPDGSADPAHRLAAQLRCPACQGESVADSRSPIAAAMRDVITAQLAQGRTPGEIRAYLVRRYGPDVLAAPAARGPGLLLWGLPVVLLLAGLAPPAVRVARTVRTTRTGRGARAVRVGRTGGAFPGRLFRLATGPDGGPRARPRRARAASAARGGRIWNVCAGCLLALVGGVAVAAPRPPAASPATTADLVPGQLALARSMEQQGRYDAAAEVYRTALAGSPSDDIRLRLAFALIRGGGGAAEAARLAGQVLADRPDSADALLMLGLAQREVDPGAAGGTLRRFLTRAPDHPAAAEVRRLLGSGG